MYRIKYFSIFVHYYNLCFNVLKPSTTVCAKHKYILFLSMFIYYM